MSAGRTNALLAVAPVTDTGHKVVETLTLDNEVKDALVLFGTVRVDATRDPTHVAQPESASFDLDTFALQTLRNAVAVVARLDLSGIKNENDLIGALSEDNSLGGIKVRRIAVLAW